MKAGFNFAPLQLYMEEKIQIVSPLSDNTLTICQAIGREDHREYVIEYYATDTEEVVGILKSGKKHNIYGSTELRIGDVVVVHRNKYELIHNSYYAHDFSVLKKDLTIPTTLDKLRCPSVQLVEGYKYVPNTFSPLAVRVRDSNFSQL